MTKGLYPPSPGNVPPEVTRVGFGFRLRAVAVLIGLFVFLLLYLGMVAGAGYLVIVLVKADFRDREILQIGLIAISTMLFIFLLKFLFKKHVEDNPYNVEIKEHTHPKLFAFIREICRETGAPLPKKIFVNHMATAAVFYNNTILSLFFPVKKNLMIGLGFVEHFNLSWFKAIMAHEFGHFSQKSMRLGSYTFMASRIIHDMVYERDRWDKILQGWRQMDLRVSIFAWILSIFVWIVRFILTGLYQVLNLLYASLSRQMELHADRISVALCGSDAVAEALARSGTASECFDFINEYIDTAAEHNLVTNNLFYHYQRAPVHLDKVDPEFTARFNRRSTPGETVFPAEDDIKPSFFTTHPTEYQRELNAKKVFVPHPIDERPAKLLFDNYDTLTSRLTMNVYKVHGYNIEDNKFKTSPPEEIEAFIESEMKASHYNPRYQGAFDERYVSRFDPMNISKLKSRFPGIETALPDSYRRLFDPELQKRVVELSEFNKSLKKIIHVLAGEDRSKTFTVKGQQYPARKAKKIFEQVRESIKEDEQWFEDFEKKLFLIHYYMAEHLKPGAGHDIQNRFLSVITLSRGVQRGSEIMRDVHKEISDLSKHGDMDYEDAKIYARNFDFALKAMRKFLRSTEGMVIPPMSNIEEGTLLRDYLFDGELPGFEVDDLSGEGINGLLSILSSINDRINRLYTKSLGTLLTLLDKVADTYTSKNTAG